MIVAANRLPVSVVRENDNLTYHSSPGGLATSLKSLQSTRSRFVGWAGKTDLKDQARVEEDLLKKYASMPVFLTDHEIDNYYSGFSNRTLWPLLHSLPNYASYKDEFYETYKFVNQMFAYKIIASLQPGESLFVHDYHLLLVPQMVRNIIPSVKIGFFLHTPFPALDNLGLLPKPVLSELLMGVMGADIIGFHTEGFAENFLTTMQQAAGIENVNNALEVNGRTVLVESLPLGIDWDMYQDALLRGTHKKIFRHMKTQHRNKKILFSVDRLDFTKGIMERLKGYELFLENNPSWHRRVVFINNIQPSRTDLVSVQQLKKQIEKLVSHINKKFGDSEWIPVIYHYHSLNFEEMIAHYTLADVAVVTPLQDGMNLVAKEFVACREQDGVLILSNTAGSAQELTSALLVDPKNIADIAQCMKQALSMDVSEQQKRLQKMQLTLQMNSSHSWANYWMRSLESPETNTQQIFPLTQHAGRYPTL